MFNAWSKAFHCNIEVSKLWQRGETLVLHKDKAYFLIEDNSNEGQQSRVYANII